LPRLEVVLAFICAFAFVLKVEIEAKTDDTSNRAKIMARVFWGITSHP
jgi:hypothetical protein